MNIKFDSKYFMGHVSEEESVSPSRLLGEFIE